MQTPSHLDYLARARSWFGPNAELEPATREIVQRAIDRRVTSTDPGKLLDQTTFGEALADRVAAFGGSWTFILVFVAVLIGWVALNTGALGAHAFDPYPYIFLNLMLSMLAAVQAPIIMMSQNRQAAKDRAQADSDYQVNLKAEMEIMALHDKLDALRVDRLEALLLQQAEQIAALRRLLHASGP